MMGLGVFDKFFNRGGKTLEDELREAKEKEKKAREDLLKAIDTYTAATKSRLDLHDDAILGLYRAGKELENVVSGLKGQVEVNTRNIERLGAGYETLRKDVYNIVETLNTYKQEIENLSRPLLAFQQYIKEVLNYKPQDLPEVKLSSKELVLEDYKQG